MSEKTAVILRTGFDAAFICSSLEKVPPKNRPILVLESGRVARKAKLKRLLKQRRLLSLLDIIALNCYEKFVRWKVAQEMPSSAYASGSQVNLEVDDVNNSSLASFLGEHGVTRILSYGTAIYSEKTLERLNLPIVNFHSGVLPTYQNVHTDFWAYLNQDLSGIGVSVFSVSKGIDNGPLIKIVRTGDEMSLRLWDYKYKNLLAITNLILDYLSDSGEPINVKPPSGSVEPGILWPTPTAGDIARYFFYELSRSFRKSWPSST